MGLLTLKSSGDHVLQTKKDHRFYPDSLYTDFSMTTTPSNGKTAGVLFALAAFFAWGILPMYWKMLVEVPAFEIMLNRIVWSLVFLVIVLTAGKRWGEVRKLFKQRRTILLLGCSSLLIAANWLIYIWSVNTNHIVEGSLGYYINPLISVILGILFLHEPVTPGKWAALLLALVGVSISIFHLGTFPWISLSLAFSFAFYGFVRKLVKVESFIGLTLETILLFPFAVAALIWMGQDNGLALGVDVSTTLLLIGAGLVTAFPQLCFASATHRLQLSTVGFIQYLGPTTQLVIGVAVYGEPFPRSQQITFGFIWLAIIIYTVDSIRLQRLERARQDKMTD